MSNLKHENNTLGIIIIVAFVSMIGPFSIDTYLPSFPSIETELTVSRAQLTLSIAFYLMATAISSLFWGPLSDRVGRKKIILGSLLLYSIASLSCAMVSGFHELLILRVLQGAAASGGVVAGRAMVRDIYDSRNSQRVMAYVLMLFALAPAIAPVIGGWLHKLFGWRSVFYFLFLYGTVMFAFSAFTFKETLHKSKIQSFHPLHVLGIYIQTLLHLRFLAIVAALATSFGGFFVYIAGSPTLLLDLLKLEGTDFWIQFLPMTTGIIIGSLISGKLIRHWSSVKIINLAFLIMLVGAVINISQAYLTVQNTFWVITPIVIYAFGVALSMPGLVVLALDCFPDNKGAAAAMQSFMQIMASGLVAGVMLPWLTQSITSYAISQMVLLLIGIVFWCISGVCKKD